MTQIFRATAGPADWRTMLADPQRHWKPGHSAMAAAQSWEHAPGLPPEIAALLPAQSRLLLAIPEHKVPLPGGSRASQCDVFALVHTQTGLCAAAIEAKVAEPFGPTLADWSATPSAGRTARLATICDWLGRDAPPPTLRYQLLHRTAAAIAEARRFDAPQTAMLVQSFSDTDQWFDDFAAFCDWLGLPPVRIGQPAILPLPDGRSLTLGWAKGDPAFLADLTHEKATS